MAPDGTVVTWAGTNTSGYVDGTGTAARCYSPSDVVVSGTTIYVTDSNNNRVRQTA